MRIGQSGLRAGEGAVVVLRDDVIDKGADCTRIARRVQPAPAHQLADLLLNNAHRVHELA
jgi:hypothetical protein